VSRQLSTIEQRIVWTRFRRQTDKDVLLAMARWFCWRADGTTRPFTVKELARKANVPKRSTERALERLEADWRIEVTVPRVRGSRRPTAYRIVVELLASADSDGLHQVETSTATVADERGPTTARVADETPPHPPLWRMNEKWRTKNRPDFEEVADDGSLSTSTYLEERSGEVVVADLSTRTSSTTCDDIRHCGGRSGGRPEHPDVSAFLAWAAVTYPQHARGAHLELEGHRRRYVVHGLLEHYGRERLEQMAVVCWTIESDGNPESHATWIAQSDRSVFVLKHKAAFLERVVVGAQQLNFGPMVKLSEREIAEAKDIRNRAYGGYCPHDPTCEDWKECVRTIALGRRVG